MTIASIGHHGHGIADSVNDRLYIPYSAPGDTVRVKITGDRGEIVEIIKASDARVTPSCSHFGDCGGCAVQHLRPDAYCDWKRNTVAVALLHQGLEANVSALIDAHGAGRRRVTLHARRSGNRVQVGFMQARSHRISDLVTCPVLSPELGRSIELVRVLGAALPDRGRGLDVQLTASEEGLDCHVTGATTIGYDQHMTLAGLAADYDLARLTLDDAVVAERRKPQLTMGLARVTLPVGGFLQATLEGERILSGLVCDRAAFIEARSVADLFCGVGPYALRLAGQARVLAVDSNAAAVDALSAAARRAPGMKPVEPMIRDLFDNPLAAQELGGYDLVVFNPPRAGAMAQAREIAASSVADVVAVSCDPSTFARDARILAEGGYKLESVTPVDQFKWTAHVEIVGVFTRR